MNPHIERILEVACAAPSRDNLQPWRFAVDGDVISFFVDSDRDRSPMNAGERMARIALGAAIESALLRAGRQGAVVKPLPKRENALFTVAITDPKRMPEPDPALVRRMTNRLPYDGRALDDATFTALKTATPPFETVSIHWFGRERVHALGPIAQQGETLFYANPRIREAALGAMRFDVRDRDEVPYGMSIGSFELSTPERVELDALRKTPHDRLSAMGKFDKMGAKARALMESSSGVCVLAAKGSEPMVDVNVGRVLQRTWLTLTRQGLVAQPLSAIPSMEAMLELGARDVFDADEAESVAAVVAKLRAAFPSIEKEARIALLLRVGWAGPPSARVGRRPVSDSVQKPTMMPPPMPPPDEPSPSGAA